MLVAPAPAVLDHTASGLTATTCYRGRADQHGIGHMHPALITDTPHAVPALQLLARALFVEVMELRAERSRALESRTLWGHVKNLLVGAWGLRAEGALPWCMHLEWCSVMDCTGATVQSLCAASARCTAARGVVMMELKTVRASPVHHGCHKLGPHSTKLAAHAAHRISMHTMH